MRNGLPAGATSVAYTTVFTVPLSLLTMNGAVQVMIARLAVDLHRSS